MSDTPTVSKPLAGDLPLAEDLPCAKCGYNLRTKRPSERCPECGSPVAPSIVYHRTLALRNPRRAALGTYLIALACFASPVITFTVEFAAHRRDLYASLFAVITHLPSALLFVGVILLRNGAARSLRAPGITFRIFASIVLLPQIIPPATAAIVYFGYYPLLTSPMGSLSFPLLAIIGDPLRIFVILVACRYLIHLGRRLQHPSLNASIAIILPSAALLSGWDMFFWLHDEFSWPWVGSPDTWIVACYIHLALSLALVLYFHRLASILRRIRSAAIPTPAPPGTP